MEREITDIFEELDGGCLPEKLLRSLCAVAAHVVDTRKDGSVTLKLKLKPIGKAANQVTLEHSIETDRPTLNGWNREKDANESPFFVGPKGMISINPPDQLQMFRDKTREDIKRHQQED